MVSQSVSFFLLQAVFTITNMYLQVVLKNQGFSYAMIGVMFAVFELSGMGGQVATGWFVDRTGKMRLTQLVCMAVTVGAMALLIRTGAFLPGLLLLVLLGFFLNSSLTLQDASANQFGKGQPDVYSIIRSAGTIGCTFFSLVYALMARPVASDNQDIFRFLAFGSLLYIPTLLVMGRDTPRVKPKDAPRSRDRWFDTSFVLAIGCIFLSRFSLATVRFLPLYAIEELGYDRVTMLQVASTASEFVAMLAAGYLMQKKSVQPVTLLFLASVGCIVRQICYALIPSVAGVMIGQCFHSLCFGFFQPAMVRFVTLHVHKDHTAQGLSLCQSLGSGLGGMVGEFACGLLIQAVGYRAMFLWYALPAALSAVLFVVLKARLQTVEET
ncbi:MAG: MFS transporter [Sphaerochaeta sp.]|nr:MFS transporter [Sphaerochaeta sp.]MCI2045208.1 MFS transporter [Sphaerochaeta sp.]MCI2096338.1 MFS transporter [Sphaerochaeta sp.]MCI2104088.1 MFS transporter [Sphaerochaeta sp.]MCI2128249.1 MFS transporter [Sphaerochaeta sp.]